MVKPQVYLKNALVLTITSFALRAAGMVFRVYLAGNIGSEGMGLYQLIFSLYNFAITFATAGISVASTRLVAEELSGGNPGSAAGALRKVITAGVALGGVAGAVQFFFAYPASNYLLGDARAELSLRILAPSLPFMAGAAALRGYFLARRRVGPNVQSQMLEQALRIGVVLWILQYTLDWGVQYSCAAVMLGNTASEIISCLCMYVFWRRDMKRAFRNAQPRVPDKVRRRLWNILLPIEGSRCLASGLSAAENMLVPACLALFCGARETALSQYGALKGMAIPVLFFPFSFITTMATLLLPEITEAHIRGHQKTLRHLLGRIVFLTNVVSVLAAGLFTIYARPLAQLLYQDAQVGLYIMVLGPAMPFMYLESMVDGILKGMGEQMSTFRYSLFDSTVRIVLVMFLLPRYGIKGFLFVMLCSNVTTCVLNVGRMVRTSGLKLDWWRWLFQPVALVALCGAAGWYAARYLALGSELATMLAGGGITAVLYLALAWRCGLGKAVGEMMQRTPAREKTGEAAGEKK